MLKKVKFVSIPVRDQQKALKFYTEKLGFSVFTDQPFENGQRWIELNVPGSDVNDTRVVLFTAPGHEKMIGSMLNITFQSDNVEKTWKELTERGVEFTCPPKKEFWGTFALFKDLDGNEFCISTK